MYVLYVTLVMLQSGLAYPRFRLLTQVSVVAAGSHPCDCHVGTTSNRESYSSAVTPSNLLRRISRDERLPNCDAEAPRQTPMVIPEQNGVSEPAFCSYIGVERGLAEFRCCRPVVI